MVMSGLSRGFSTCCLRFKNGVATTPARLASGWPAAFTGRESNPLGRDEGFSDHRPSHAFANLTPTSRANTYGRYRTSVAALLRIEEMRTDMARQQVAQIESAIADLDQTARALEHEIEIEHNRTGIRDPGHIAYSMYAKATTARRDNLKRTITELKERLAEREEEDHSDRADAEADRRRDASTGVQTGSVTGNALIARSSRLR
jgi:hypothetical protein